MPTKTSTTASGPPEEDDGIQWVGTADLAKLFGCTARYIDQLVSDGVLPRTEKKVGGRGKYNKDKCVTAYVVFLRDKRRGRPPSEVDQDLQKKKLKAEVALKESQAELHNIKTDIAAGKYVLKNTVQAEYESFLSTFRRFALSMPTRLVGMLSDQIDPTEARRVEAELLEEVKRMLLSFIAAGSEQPPTYKAPSKRGRKKKAEKVEDDVDA